MISPEFVAITRLTTTTILLKHGYKLTDINAISYASFPLYSRTCPLTLVNTLKLVVHPTTYTNLFL